MQPHSPEKNEAPSAWSEGAGLTEWFKVQRLQPMDTAYYIDQGTEYPLSPIRGNSFLNTMKTELI
jgi:hypothetical protein